MISLGGVFYTYECALSEKLFFSSLVERMAVLLSSAMCVQSFVQEVLKPLICIALELSKLQQLTGRDRPTVIT